VADAAYIPAAGVALERRPAVGYAMVAAAAALFGFNGSVAKVILDSGLSSLRVTEVRCTGALIGFAALVLVTRRRALRTNLRELLHLTAFGVLGVCFVQLFYFLAIHRLKIGVALLIQYLGPLFIALWARFVMKEHVRRRLWAALILSLFGLSLVVDVWRGVTLNSWGVVFAFAAAITFAFYVLSAEQLLSRRDPVSLLCYGFLFASVFYAVIQPWWSYPFRIPAHSIALEGRLSSWHLPIWALMLWMVVLGTIVPFILVVGSLRHLRATRVAIVGMLEPVVATVVAYAWLDQRLGAQQLVGGSVVLAGILLAQTARE
jgi:drug/metabolite transporter (DMT)-like permease